MAELRQEGSAAAGRESRFLAVFDQIVAEARERLVAAAPAGVPWAERLALGLAELFALIEANPAAARVVFVRAPGGTPKTLERYLATIAGVAPFMGRGRGRRGGSAAAAVDAARPGGVAYLLGIHLSRGSAQPVSALYAEALELLAMPCLSRVEVRELIDAYTPPFLRAQDRLETPAVAPFPYGAAADGSPGSHREAPAVPATDSGRRHSLSASGRSLR